MIRLKEEKQRLMQGMTQQEAVRDAERQYRKRSKHVYPNSLGVTGQAYHQGQVIYCNKMAKLTGFLPSIDNLTTNVKDVHSLMIVPIFGHRARMVQTKEHGPQESLFKESLESR